MSTHQLQVNTNGAWKTVLQFDDGDVVAAMRVREGALALHLAAPCISFRVASLDKPPEVLRYLTKGNYSSWVYTKKII